MLAMADDRRRQGQGRDGVTVRGGHAGLQANTGSGLS